MGNGGKLASSIKWVHKGVEMEGSFFTQYLLLIFLLINNNVCLALTHIQEGEYLCSYCRCDAKSFFPETRSANGNHLDSQGLSLLCLAVLKDCAICIKDLVEKGARKDLGLGKDLKPGNSRWIQGDTVLHIAARQGKVTALQALLEGTVALEHRNTRDETPLHSAIVSKSIDAVRLLLNRGADIEAKKKDLSPLFLASLSCDFQMIEFLLERGANGDTQNAMQETPLRYLEANKIGTLCVYADYIIFLRCRALLKHKPKVAAEKIEMYNDLLRESASRGYPENITFALDNGACINARDAQGLTPLMCDFKHGQTYTARKLLTLKDSHGDSADMHVTTPDGKSLLHIAIESSAYGCIDIWLAQKLSLESADNEGLRPLHYAVRANELGTLTRLLEDGALIESQTTAGYTPLMLAAHLRRFRAFECLLQAGAQVPGSNPSGERLLFIACEDPTGKCLQAFLRRVPTVDLNARDGKNTTPLGSAIMSRNETVVKLLVEGGADLVEAPEDSSGFFPVHRAIDIRSLEALKLILKHSPDEVNRQTTHERLTPLMHAIIEVNRQTTRKRLTPLWHAITVNNLPMVQELLSTGADLSREDNRGRTALHWAVGSDELVNMLLNY